MSKLKLTQTEIDGLVTVDRVLVNPTVYGVGCNDVDFEVKIDGKIVWQYQLWQSMMCRCFDAKYKQHRPTYENVTCCDDWLSFATFLEWINKEVGYSGKPSGFDLDKDILVRGNKHYSPGACSLVPRAVNSLLTGRGSERGEWPIGVCFHNKSGKFTARLRCGGVRKNIGLYHTPEDAFAAYKIAKEAHIKIVATQYKDVLKPAVFESLMSWEVTP